MEAQGFNRHPCLISEMEVTPRSPHGATETCKASASVPTHCSGSQSSHVRARPGGQDPLPGPLHVITRWYRLLVVYQRRGHLQAKADTEAFQGPTLMTLSRHIPTSTSHQT